MHIIIIICLSALMSIHMNISDSPRDQAGEGCMTLRPEAACRAGEGYLTLRPEGACHAGEGYLTFRQRACAIQAPSDHTRITVCPYLYLKWQSYSFKLPLLLHGSRCQCDRIIVR